MTRDEGSTPSADLSTDELVALYRDMLYQRRFEETTGRVYQMGKIYGFCHLYIGQEAISTGVAKAMEEGDKLISAYRIHAQALACGIPPEEVMGELMGRKTGSVQGLGGSMHLFDPDRGFYGGWGLVGQQVPTAAGVAFAEKYRGGGGVIIGMFGDGALHQGAIHESLNMAKVYELPILFLLENNQYGMGTAVERISALQPAHGLAEPYGIEHDEFDGMDVLETYDAVKTAIEKIRETSQPIFLEARCSRFRGHSMSDPAKYRTKDQLEDEKSNDPIPRLRVHLLDTDGASEEELDGIDDEIKESVKTLVKEAEDAAWPDESLIDKYVYAEAGGDHG